MDISAPAVGFPAPGRVEIWETELPRMSWHEPGMHQLELVDVPLYSGDPAPG